MHYSRLASTLGRLFGYLVFQLDGMVFVIIFCLWTIKRGGNGWCRLFINYERGAAQIILLQEIKLACSLTTASWYTSSYFTLIFYQGDTNYIFDGTSAARLPRTVVGLNWEKTFTIAAWILVKTAPNPQFILSWSDGKHFGHNYIGLYVINKGDGKKPRVGFMINKDKGRCRFNEEWNIALWDTKWRHVAVAVDDCNLQVKFVVFFDLVSRDLSISIFIKVHYFAQSSNV